MAFLLYSSTNRGNREQSNGIWLTVRASLACRRLVIFFRSLPRKSSIDCRNFMVRQLPAWFENLGKRQVKAP
jgi:hypothetical protein